MKKIRRILTIQSIRLYLNSTALYNKEKAGESALYTFCTPRSGWLVEKDFNFLKTASHEHDLMLRDINIRCYHWKGEGPTVLLAHGWESKAARWKKLIKKLISKKFNVVALDAPAHGQSGSTYFYAPLYAEMIAQVANQYQPSFIVGHSIGGFASTYYAALHRLPSLQRMVIMGAPAELEHSIQIYQQMLGLSDAVMEGMERVFVKKFGHDFKYYSGPTLVQNMDTPVLIIHDQDDAAVPYAAAEAYAKHWPNNQLITTKDAGHALNNEECLQHVIRYLTTL